MLSHKSLFWAPSHSHNIGSLTNQVAIAKSANKVRSLKINLIQKFRALPIKSKIKLSAGYIKGIFMIELPFTFKIGNANLINLLIQAYQVQSNC